MVAKRSQTEVAGPAACHQAGGLEWSRCTWQLWDV